MILEANWIVSAQMLQKEDPFKFMVPNPRIKMTPVQDGNDALNTSSSEEMFKLSPITMTSIVSMSMSKNSASSLKVLNCSQIAANILS
jgi:hypothetical protein